MNTEDYSNDIDIGSCRIPLLELAPGRERDPLHPLLRRLHPPLRHLPPQQRLRQQLRPVSDVPEGVPPPGDAADDAAADGDGAAARRGGPGGQAGLQGLDEGEEEE